MPAAFWLAVIGSLSSGLVGVIATFAALIAARNAPSAQMWKEAYEECVEELGRRP